MVDPREWLIRKDGYFYRPNCAGYTTSKFEAGRYTKSEAEREAAVEPWHMKAIHQDDVEDDPVSSRVRMDGETIASLKARISELERVLAERAGGVKGEWHRADGDKSILLYTLRQDGWRKGEAVMVNDVTVRIEAANGSESPIEPIASAILSTLTTEPAAPEGRQEAVAWRVKGAQYDRVFLDEVEARAIADGFLGVVIPLYPPPPLRTGGDGGGT